MASHHVCIVFTEELWADLFAEAARNDCSVAAVVRECVANDMRRRRLAKIRKGLPK